MQHRTYRLVRPWVSWILVSIGWQVEVLQQYGIQEIVDDQEGRYSPSHVVHVTDTVLEEVRKIIVDSEILKESDSLWP